MSRSGYSDECDFMGLYRQTVVNATNGKRGQKLLRDLLAALDAMPEKRLITGALIDDAGEVCALGALGRQRDLPLAEIDVYDHDGMADTFGVSRSLACEIQYMNDEWFGGNSPEELWTKMRAWVASQIRATEDHGG